MPLFRSFFFLGFRQKLRISGTFKKNENFQGFLLFFADFRRINVLDILIRVHFCLLMSWFENEEEKISSKKKLVSVRVDVPLKRKKEYRKRIVELKEPECKILASANAGERERAGASSSLARSPKN